MSGLYDYRWQKARKLFLEQHPFCQCPNCDEGKKQLRPAEVVDHIVPHRGNTELFWDEKNWQALAKECHDSYKQKLERSGTVIGADDNGIPTDPNHHWNT